MRLEGLRSDGGEEHGVQAERFPGSMRHTQMAQVGRVKAATKKSYATPAVGLAAFGVGQRTHVFMVA
jgi:hypothetical protein